MSPKQIAASQKASERWSYLGLLTGSMRMALIAVNNLSRHPLATDTTRQKARQVADSIRGLQLVGQWRTDTKCVNHPDRVHREVLDCEPLCFECADAWVQAEGHAAQEHSL